MKSLVLIAALTVTNALVALLVTFARRIAEPRRIVVATSVAAGLALIGVGVAVGIDTILPTPGSVGGLLWLAFMLTGLVISFNSVDRAICAPVRPSPQGFPILPLPPLSPPSSLSEPPERDPPEART